MRSSTGAPGLYKPLTADHTSIIGGAHQEVLEFRERCKHGLETTIAFRLRFGSNHNVIANSAVATIRTYLKLAPKPRNSNDIRQKALW